ncbi:MAG: bifunctional 5,10-methylenetetrahydrofolate dehydrogenase/5,10-methenyltetrahydrofolate cyclohydrolase [Candidatus Komeilibacteria bacterium]
MSKPIPINLTIVAEPLPDKRIIDGKALAEQIKLDISKEILAKNLRPNLAVILVGDDPASQLYVKMKETACKLVGIELHKYLLPADVAEKELLASIDFLNQDETVDAILIQLPLPPQFDQDAIISRLDPAKDVDGFHQANIKLLLEGKPRLIPGLVLSVLKLLEATGEDLTDKKALIIGKSPVFTLPMKAMLEKITAETSIIEPEANNLAQLCSQADILITAAGQRNLITEPMVKSGAIVIDIGINKTPEGKTCGDVDFAPVLEKVSHITPVPGGVGPMTVATLLFNTLLLTQQ